MTFPKTQQGTKRDSTEEYCLLQEFCYANQVKITMYIFSQTSVLAQPAVYLFLAHY